MEVPRLGDDALMYLSKGKLFFTPNYEHSPLKTSILDQFNNATEGDSSLETIKWRITNQVTGNLYLLSEPILGAIQIFPLSSKWQFAIYESCVALILSLALLYFWTSFFSPVETSLAFLSLSFVLLPVQGLHYFVPSILTFSAALALLTYVINNRSSPKCRILFPTVFFVCGLHLLAKAYLVVISLALAILVFFEKKNKKNLTIFIIASLLSFFLWELLIRYSGLFNLPINPRTDVGAYTFSESLKLNLLPAWNQLIENITRYPMFILPGIGYISFGFFKNLKKPAYAVFIASVLILSASLLHFFRNYPAEIFFRMYSLFFVSAIAFTGKFFEKIYLKKWLRFSFIFLFSVNIFFAAKSWSVFMYDNMNGRPGVFLEENISPVFSQLKDLKKSIVYLETEIALRLSMLYGAENLPAVVFPAIVNEHELEEVLNRVLPSVAVAPNYDAVYSLAFNGSWVPAARKVGYIFRDLDHLKMSCTPLCIPKDIWLYIENGASAFSLLVTLEEGKKSTTTQLNISKKQKGWVPLEQISSSTTPHQVQHIILSAKNQKAWLTGLSIGPPEKHLMWPWDKGIKLSSQYRKSHRTFQSVDFSTSAFLDYWKASSLKPLIKNARVISDDSGLVFIDFDIDKSSIKKDSSLAPY